MHNKIKKFNLGPSIEFIFESKTFSSIYPYELIFSLRFERYDDHKKLNRNSKRFPALLELPQGGLPIAPGRQRAISPGRQMAKMRYAYFS